MSKLALKLASHGSFPPPFSNVGGVLTKRSTFAAVIGEGNILESLPIGTYIHDLKHVVEFQDVLSERLDYENGPHPSTWNVAVVAWKAFFCETLSWNVNVFFVANSHNYVSEALRWWDGIGATAD
jgi:hypothetical protein